ncbi:YfaZ family outer membrane protein [uncultured Desulfuromusa sp.]|uniref:YfaZ family outer membrane protein n=1 Tax=uncultured Desulfuromusa sp. TaxID=219183 RepID=UPI002AA77788|nr:YfaZ family outer membrane protein [uncultured Desulfuromusa sp.]
MRLPVLLSLLITLFSTPAIAGSVDIGLNDDSFQIGFEQALSNDNYGNSFGNARFLYNGDEETKMGSIGFDFIGRPGNLPGLSVGAGSKLYLGKTDHDAEFINLGIGLRTDYTLPQLQGLGVSAGLYYAPDVFSGRDSNKLMDFQVRLTYAIIPKVKLFLGYQNIQLDVDGSHGTWTIDDGIRAGFVGSF